MASKEYSTVRYYSTKDIAKLNIPEAQLDHAKDRENYDGNSDYFSELLN